MLKFQEAIKLNWVRRVAQAVERCTPENEALGAKCAHATL